MTTAPCGDPPYWWNGGHPPFCVCDGSCRHLTAGCPNRWGTYTTSPLSVPTIILPAEPPAPDPLAPFTIDVSPDQEAKP